MLRPLRCPYIGPRLIAFRGTTGSLAVTSTVGRDDAYTATSAGAGIATVTLRYPFQRVPLVITQPWTTIGAGAIGGIYSAPSKTAFSTLTSDTDGTATDGKTDGLCLGFDSVHTFDTPYSRLHNVLSTGSAYRLMTFYAAGGSSAVSTNTSQVYSFSAISAGYYKITFTHPFAQAPLVYATVASTTAGVVCVHASYPDYIEVKCYNAAGAAATQNFNLFVLGQDSGDTSAGHRKTLNTCCRKARLLPFEITITGGTPSLTAGLGNEIATITDGGAGIYTIAYDEDAIGRAGEIIACADGSNIATISAQATTGFTVRTFDNAGSAGDASIVHCIAVIYDDASEF